MAIKVNELRVGNWYKQLHTGEYTQVSLFLFYELYDDETYADHLMPIPLTPDILEACGFEKDEAYDCTLSLGELSIHLPSALYKKGRTYFKSWCIIEGVPAHLHQLQNLYFALTNSELEYKPKDNFKFPDDLDKIEPGLNTLMQLKQKENK